MTPISMPGSMPSIDGIHAGTTTTPCAAPMPLVHLVSLLSLRLLYVRVCCMYVYIPHALSLSRSLSLFLSLSLSSSLSLSPSPSVLLPLLSLSLSHTHTRTRTGAHECNAYCCRCRSYVNIGLFSQIVCQCRSLLSNHMVM